MYRPADADHPLGHGLVQGQGADERIGEGVGNPVHLQQGRHLGLAAAAVQALGDVEHEVPPFAAGELPGQSQAVADALGGVSERLQGPLDGGNRRRRVELGHLFLGETLGEIIVSEVVDQSYNH